MDLLYIENYFILSVFLSFFMIEIGISLLSIFKYSEYGTRLKKYLLPIWAIDGTFAVFYLVNVEAAYPNIINTIGYAYAAPVLVGGIFLVLRNAFLSYSELAHLKTDEKSYVRIYAVSTIVIAAIVVYALSSAMSGFGVDILAKQINPLAMVTSGFNLLILLAALILSLSATIIYFGIKEFRYTGISGMFFAAVLVVYALSQYDHAVMANLLSNAYLLAIALLAVFITAILTFRLSRYAKYAVLATLIIGINAFGAAQYPHIFGSASIVSYENNSVIAPYIIAFTTVGTVITFFFLLYLFHLGHKSARSIRSHYKPKK